MYQVKGISSPKNQSFNPPQSCGTREAKRQAFNG